MDKKNKKSEPVEDIITVSDMFESICFDELLEIKREEKFIKRKKKHNG